MAIETQLFDVNKFDLDAHFPRKPVVTRNDPRPLLSRQPFTALYLLLYVPVLMLLVPPYAVLRYAYMHFTSSAPAAQWGLLNYVTIYVVRHLTTFWWTLTQGGLRGLAHGATRKLSDEQRLRRRRWFGSMPDYVPVWRVAQLQGPMLEWARETGVRDDDEVAVSVWWMGKRAKDVHQRRAEADEKLLVYFTGGGYMISTCHPVVPLSHLNNAVLGQFEAYASKAASADAANAVPRSSITVEYRKSGAAPTPSAFLDCLAAYKHVVDTLGFRPENITLLGDSAGGHLVNTLIRYLIDTKCRVPDAAILVAPWTDQAGTMIEHPTSSYRRNISSDVLSDAFYSTCRDTFAMHFRRPQDTLLDVYFSPCAVLGKVHRDGVPITTDSEPTIFRGWPRTLLFASTGDVLFDQTTEMHRRLRVAGVQSTIVIGAGCHDPFIAPPFVFADERRKALAGITAWFLGGGGKDA